MAGKRAGPEEWPEAGRKRGAGLDRKEDLPGEGDAQRHGEDGFRHHHQAGVHVQARPCGRPDRGAADIGYGQRTGAREGQGQQAETAEGGSGHGQRTWATARGSGQWHRIGAADGEADRGSGQGQRTEAQQSAGWDQK